MGVEKECLSDKEINAVIISASRISEEARRIILILLYTGMHISVLCKPKKGVKNYDLQIINKNKKLYFQWKRPKKKGKEAIVNIPVVPEIDFEDSLRSFIKHLRTRRRKSNRIYYYRLLKKIGKGAGVPNLSPMSLRHTFGLILADKGFNIDYIIQKMNCTRKTAESYLKYSTKRSDDVFERLW